MKKLIALAMAFSVIFLLSSCDTPEDNKSGLTSTQPPEQTALSSTEESAVSVHSDQNESENISDASNNLSESSVTVPSTLAAQKIVLLVDNNITREHVKSWEERNIYMKDANNFLQPSLSFVYNDPMFKERLGDNFITIKSSSGISRHRGNVGPEVTIGYSWFVFMKEGSTPVECEVWRFEGQFYNDYSRDWEFTDYYLEEEDTENARNAWKEDPLSKASKSYYLADIYDPEKPYHQSYKQVFVEWTPSGE